MKNLEKELQSLEKVLIGYLATNLETCQIALPSRSSALENRTSHTVLNSLLEDLSNLGFEYVNWEVFSYRCSIKELAIDDWPMTEVLGPQHAKASPVEIRSLLPFLYDLQNLLIKHDLLQPSLTSSMLWHDELLRIFSLPLHSIVPKIELDSLHVTGILDKLSIRPVRIKYTIPQKDFG
ncbi:hypothetical protein [Arundinibacter roseus]|uniref:Uncharacterized protein n=1 Tax=Arundinibacter roseus TaxID=2070510 RepID=A0A4R4KLE5_9BACT|nr:hypothetical protein [Arundinibacter roseus]TDB69078.1 hypothetical protein EZE20_01720 [Arundinibacter roseus]